MSSYRKYDVRKRDPDPKSAVLLVIDMQNYFYSMAKPILPAIKATIDLCRQQSMRVIFTRHRHKSPDDYGMLYEWWDGDLIMDSTVEAELIPQLGPTDSDLVVEKTTYSAFTGRDIIFIPSSQKMELSKVGDKISKGQLPRPAIASAVQEAIGEGRKTGSEKIVLSPFKQETSINGDVSIDYSPLSINGDVSIDYSPLSITGDVSIDYSPLSINDSAAIQTPRNTEREKEINVRGGEITTPEKETLSTESRRSARVPPPTVASAAVGRAAPFAATTAERGICRRLHAGRHLHRRRRLPCRNAVQPTPLNHKWIEAIAAVTTFHRNVASGNKAIGDNQDADQDNGGDRPARKQASKQIPELPPSSSIA
nr:nicotinamidase 2-like [Ipomoea trifida]